MAALLIDLYQRYIDLLEYKTQVVKVYTAAILMLALALI